MAKVITMPCQMCEYYYTKIGKESKTVYNSLSESNVTIQTDKKYHVCGLNPQGVFLDDDRPACKEYKERT